MWKRGNKTPLILPSKIIQNKGIITLLWSECLCPLPPPRAPLNPSAEMLTPNVVALEGGPLGGD